MIEALGDLQDTGPHSPAPPAQRHLSQSFKERYLCPRIEEESESEVTEHASRDSCVSTGRSPLIGVTTLSGVREPEEEEAVASEPSATKRDKQRVSKFNGTPLPQPRISTAIQRKSAEQGNPQKDSLRSEETQDATQELPLADAPQKRIWHGRNVSETWAVRPGVSTVSKNPPAQSITKRLREFGLKKSLKSSMVSVHSQDPEVPVDGGIKRSQTRPENEDRDPEVTLLHDPNPLRWLFSKHKKANLASVKDQILATLGLPSSAREPRPRQAKEATQSFDVTRGRWKQYSNSCVFTSGGNPSSADQP